jgi:hypothetical protein
VKSGEVFNFLLTQEGFKRDDRYFDTGYGRKRFTFLETEELPYHLRYSICNHTNEREYKPRKRVNYPFKVRNHELGGEGTCAPHELPHPPNVLLNHAGVRRGTKYCGVSTTIRLRNKYVTYNYYAPNYKPAKR